MFPSSPPLVPAARMLPEERPSHTLIWVRTGRARVLVDDDAEYLLAEGEGIWMPPGYRRRSRTLTEPGTVAFPYWLDARVGAGTITEPIRFTVPADWQDWLIQYFNLQITPFTGRGYSPDGVADLFRGSGTRTPPIPRTGPTAPLDALIMPKAAGARAVAEELLRDPALALTVEDWAARVLSSPRTLRRDFLADTGSTFEQWRLRCRLTAAVELLAAGGDVDQVAARVGFASRGGFRRAFRQQLGSTPHEFAKIVSTRAPDRAPGGRAQGAGPVDDLLHMVRGDEASAVAPELLPPAHMPPHANDSHVLSWMYRGSGYLDIGGERYERHRGVATWIPADVEHTTGLRPGSISLPLGNVSTADLRLTGPLHAQFSPAWDDYLMFCSVSARTPLRPDGHDPRHILDLFAEQVAMQRALSVPMPTDPRAREAAMDYLRRIGAAAPLDLPADVHRRFREETGMTFARWRYAARMRVARELLAGGAKPSAVSRRVGYSHLPNFSTAFTRFHGVSPREYREREAETA